MDSALSARVEELLQHRRWVQALARSLVRDEALAEDLAQETLVTAIERPPAERTSLRGWLATVLRNRFRDRLRTESRRARREESVARPEGTASADELAARAEAHRRVIEAVVGLDEPYRETVLLRYYEGLDTREVARRQGVGASTVRTRISRALERLRLRLDCEQGGDGRAWIVALVPLLEPRPGTDLLKGAALMATKARIGAFVLCGAAVVSVVVVAVVASVVEKEARVEPEAALETARVADQPDSAELPAGAAPSVEDEGDPAPPPSKGELPARTRRTGLATLPLENEIRIEVGRDGSVSFGEFTAKYARDVPVWKQPEHLELRELLFPEADAARDMTHPAQPSERNLLLHCAGDTPWWIIRAVTAAPADPAIRIYRIHWSVLPAESGKEAGLPVFLPTDRGLARTRVRLNRAPKPRVALVREAGEGSTTVRFIGTDLGKGEPGFAELSKRLPALLDEWPESGVVIEPWGDVPVSEVVRALDLVPGEPNSSHLVGFGGETGIHGFSESSDETEELLRGALKLAKLEVPGDLLDPDEGLTATLWRFLTARRAAGEIVDLFEGLVAREPADLPRIRELLTRQEHSRMSIAELEDKARTGRGLLLGLSRAYLRRGWDGDFLRAATLAGLVASADPRRTFTGGWWYCQVLTLRAYFGYAERKKDARALQRGTTLLDSLEKLAAAGNSPWREWLAELREEAGRIGDRLE